MKKRNVIRNVLAMLTMAVGISGYAPDAQAASSSSSTRQFIHEATVANGFEILTSRLAAERSRDPEIRDFARHMIEAHRQADEQLRQTVMASHFRMQNMPNDLDPAHREQLERLENARGPEFDRLYVQIQSKAHNQAVALFRRYAQSGRNPDLRNYARETLPELQEHQEHVRELRVYR